MSSASNFHNRQISLNNLAKADINTRNECKRTYEDMYNLNKQEREEIVKNRKEVYRAANEAEDLKNKSNSFSKTEIEECSKIGKETISKRAPEKGLPPLYRCAELLKERVHLINYDNSLYYYNGKCYDYVDSMDIVKIYRERVDNKLSYEKSMNNILQLHKFLSTDADISVKPFKNYKRIAVLNNGIYDVVKEELIAHNSKEVVFSYIDANYVANSKCKHFERFLYEVTGGNDVLQKRLWMFLGYMLIQTTEAQIFFVMGEAPDSGKSLLGNFIESLFPIRYVSNIALNDFNKEFSLSPIVGSAVNISLDLPASKLNTVAVSRLKMLTGGDAININKKFVSEFRYENRAKFIFASNSPISIANEDDAFWNRLIYLPFDRTIPKAEQNSKLPEIFKKEKDAIVSRALQYAKELIAMDFEFPSTPMIDHRMQVWRGRSNVAIENFLKECCVCGQGYRGELLDNLYLEYEYYCENTGYVPQNRNVFKNFLEEQVGLKHCKIRDGGINPQSAFKGISLIRGEYYGD